MKFFGSKTSPYARHCRIALLQAGVEFDFLETIAASAENPSPTRRIPYLEDGELHLSDSTSILAHLRARSGAPFLKSAQEFDSYALINTLLDSEINLFLFERLDGLLPEASPHLQRQRKRVATCLAELEARALPLDESSDVSLRLVCALDWGKFRQRFSFEEHPHLRELHARASELAIFQQTDPRLA